MKSDIKSRLIIININIIYTINQTYMLTDLTSLQIISVALNPAKYVTHAVQI